MKIRLYEIGPRINLKLLKQETGFLGGAVKFHAYHSKTEEEMKLLQ